MAYDKRLSKFLSLVLRHQPEVLGLSLDPEGYVGVGELVRALRQKGYPTLVGADLESLVAGNDKQRFAFNEDRTLIRASQGHSQPVDLGLKPVVPPDILFHGTAMGNLTSIKEHGLLKRKRQHVHLSVSLLIAHGVGSRHGTAIAFPVEAGRMHLDGHVFYKSANGVWLTDHVPPTYLQVGS